MWGCGEALTQQVCLLSPRCWWKLGPQLTPDQLLGTQTSECPLCHWWVDFVVYTWSNGPCCSSLSGWLCTNIKIDDTHLSSLLGSQDSVAMAGCQYNLPTPPRKTETLTLKWVSLGRDSPHVSLLFVARNKVHPVWPWMRFALDFPRLPDVYLFPAASVLHFSL